MKRASLYICLVIVVAINPACIAQTDWLAEAKLAYDTAQYSKANTALHADYLSQEEKNLILLMNLAKLDGRIFCEKLLSRFIIETRIKESSYTLSLAETLTNTAQKRMFIPQIDLFRAAEYHAIDMGKSGKTGHDSSDGTGPFDRVQKFYPSFVAENCSYGNSTAMSILCQLLIDEGVESLGHRTNILNNGSRIGVAIRPHIYYRYNCVMDFGYVYFSEVPKTR